MNLDALSEVRSAARARAQEDFEYFANSVLGLRLTQSFCSDVQKRVEAHNEEFILTPARAEASALNAWLVVLGRRDISALDVQGETFCWLFGEYAKRAA